MTGNRVQDGPSCAGCGLPNYEGICPHCRGDLDEYERELAPFFGSYVEDTPMDEEDETG